MRRWSLLLACGLVNVHAMAQDAPPAPPTPDAPSAAIAPTPAPTPVPAIHQAGKTTIDGEIHDSIGYINVRPLPDVQESLPLFLQRVDYLRKHHDDVMAIGYLRQVIVNGDILPQYRARAILELADCLGARHQDAEALCWLKIWMELYPSRPEIGAVAYRVGYMYTQMGFSDLARDAYYLALAHTINEGHVQSAEDLKRYTELTVGTLWGLATNEYHAGKWARAAELFARYRKECPTASPLSLEKAAFLQADCYYQLKQRDQAISLYEETLSAHPFNPLAPQSRLRLYHLYYVNKAPDKAREELEALAWTVRTVWPQDETYWQKQTAQLLLALNQKNEDVLPPLIQQSSHLSPEGKTWQEALNHYDALVSYQAKANAIMDDNVDSSSKAESRRALPEEVDLLNLNRSLDQLLPPARTASNQ